MNFLAINPELQKGLWREFTDLRVIATISIALIVLALVLATESEESGRLVRALTYVSAIGFGCSGSLTLLSALHDEFSRSTWDVVRLSPMRPWKVTWGVLLGESSFAWFGVAICLSTGFGALAFRGELTGYDLVIGVPSVVGVSLLAQGAALVGVVSTPPERGAARSNGSLFLFVLFVFLGISWVPHVADQAQGDTAWWSMKWQSRWFWLASLYGWVFWVIVGCHQVVRRCLQFNSSVLAWTLFNIYLVVYVYGFVGQVEAEARAVVGEVEAQVRAVVAVAPALALFYATLLLQPVTPSLLKRIEVSLMERRFGGLASQVPLWVYCWLVALASCVTFASGVHETGAVLFAFSLTLLALRDMCLFAGIHLSSSRPMSSAMSIVLLAVVYALLPALLEALGLHFAWLVFVPVSTTDYVGLTILLVEVVLLAGFAIGRGTDVTRGRTSVTD